MCTNMHLSAYVTRDTEVYLSGHTCVGVGHNRLSIVCRAHAFVVVVLERMGQTRSRTAGSLRSTERMRGEETIAHIPN